MAEEFLRCEKLKEESESIALLESEIALIACVIELLITYYTRHFFTVIVKVENRLSLRQYFDDRCLISLVSLELKITLTIFSYLNRIIVELFEV